MPIDFHDSSNKWSYTSRSAEDQWIRRIGELAEINGKQVLDLGCGGGIYTRALALAGAAHVTAMDFSREMLDGAARNCRELANISFVQGSALDTCLEDETFDLLLERALIHHLRQLDLCFREARRILKPKGRLIIQDRTPEDCSLPGTRTHIRGYFFEKFPHLLEQEMGRRYTSEQVCYELTRAGFQLIAELEFWETRTTYEQFAGLETDLLNRTGRSILHELSDEDLAELVSYIKERIEQQQPIEEKDRWTVWIAEKQ